MADETRTYRLDKLLIARSQLLTAIDLFFDDKDPFSIHTLARNACEVLESLCDEAGARPFREKIKVVNPTVTNKDIWNARNRFGNSFKHAGSNDDEDVIAEFKESENDTWIYLAVTDYLTLRRKAPIPMQVFNIWYFAVHEDNLHPSEDPTPYRKEFPNIQTMERWQQKAFGRIAIQHRLLDRELCADPKTEPLLVG